MYNNVNYLIPLDCTLKMVKMADFTSRVFYPDRETTHTAVPVVGGNARAILSSDREAGTARVGHAWLEWEGRAR